MADEITPRLIRATAAPTYLSVSRDWFTVHVRPHLREARIGKQGVVFDRLDLDRFADEYMARNGRRPTDEKGETSWVAKLKPDSASAMASGTSTAFGSKDSQRRFTEALARAISQVPSASRRR